MNTLPALRSTPVPALAWAILAASIATTLDLAFAIIYWQSLHDVSPLRVMQAIAAYWGWGRNAYSGGVDTAVLGATLFFARMCLLAVLYQIVARRYTVLVERPYLCGALFGLAIYLSTQYLMVPLIASMPPKPAFDRDLVWVSSCITAHMGLIGIPLALFARLAIHADD
ncbi:hypothetical protein IP90_01759 [Luteimonas cucumeris]|uniref:Uncharacterized protein n=1 Tax=Luteimonas cucumeris TaxID=985012 RepID=A0A562L4S2_9GAMM|nr:hypothetical protein [Luteimonas cucumeris]TWI02662.1 hypothetical protein IP90_01759 [Luteimonas cucumeris]